MRCYLWNSTFLKLNVMFFDPKHQNFFQNFYILRSIDFSPSFDEMRRYNSAVTCNCQKKPWLMQDVCFPSLQELLCGFLQSLASYNNLFFCLQWISFHPQRFKHLHNSLGDLRAEDFFQSRWLLIWQLVCNIFPCNKISFSNFFLLLRSFCSHFVTLPVLPWI